jgi:outer membrane protein assembly factor BamB
MVVDLLPGEHRPLVLMSRAFALTAVIDLEGNPHWHYGLTRDTTARSHAGIGDLDGDGKLEIVTSQADGLLRAFSAEAADAICPSCLPGQEPNVDTRAGHTRWEYKLNGPLSDFASADLDGDGRHELLVGSGDGSLHALEEVNGKCTVLWKYDFNSPVGSPVVADLDADGSAEILVPVADGYLHCLTAAKSARTNGE